MSRRGFTLIELLVALVLMGIVSTAVYQLLVNNQRVYQQQTERVKLNETLRSAVAILPAELREEDATDPIESDIIAMTSSSITFKAMRNLYQICQTPVNGGNTGTVIVYQSPFFGLRRLDTSRDSLVIFAEADSSTRTDNYWVHANLSATTSGTACPGTTGSYTLSLTNVTPSGGLADVTAGAPLRGFEVDQVLTYTDVQGDLWLGMRQNSKSGGWGSTQPILGPLAASGLQFSYFDASGTATTDPTQVARIGITVIGETAAPVRFSGGATRTLVDTLTTQVALRNNLR